MRLHWPGTRSVRTDEEYVERIRHAVAVMDRSRKWFQVFYVTMTLAFFGVLFAFAELFRWLIQWNGVFPGFIVGMSLGGMIGGLALHLGHGLANSLTSQRTERLLLRYHDALVELAKQSIDPPTCPDSSDLCELVGFNRRDSSLLLKD